MERCAHGYSHDRLAAELRATGENDRADFIDQIKQLNGLVGPSDPEYNNRYPGLTNEPQRGSI